MGFKCSVPKCRGNYNKEEKVHVFGLPKDIDLREAWIAAIPRKDFTYSKNSKVSIFPTYL